MSLLNKPRDEQAKPNPARGLWIGEEEDRELIENVQKNASPGADGFGEKRITFFGGVSLLLNNITGPGMVQLPQIFQQAGWVTPSLALVYITVVSSFAATMMCKAMALIPGNSSFQGRIELGGLAKHYFPRWGYWLTVLLLVVSMQAVNISSIIITAQTTDFAFVTAFKWVGGVEIYPDPGFKQIHSAGDSNSPFENIYVVSIGFVCVLLFSIPLGYFNLDDNIFLQVVFFLIIPRDRRR
eukprot:TRINITY_DN4273_c0_g1_i2.p2 TRINITY_DN4273_c0_g1~~TRINITY_DN4273_c0_g1_i2.p2  ORF type:complete len:240 (+),score=37.56 TRINITY_DN4273_c0_g1_i2:115-834(+)